MVYDLRIIGYQLEDAGSTKDEICVLKGISEHRKYVDLTPLTIFWVL